MTAYLDVEDLLDIAAVVLRSPPKVRDHGLLASAAARPGATVGHQEAYPELRTKAAALLHSLCANHALVDGNRRLAWAAAVVFRHLNTGEPVRDVDTGAAEELVVAVASGELREVADIAGGLRRLGLPG